MSTSSAASKPAIPGRLVATTYRQLLRLALRFDLDPAFRSLVCVSHASVYSGELQCWRGIPRSKDASPIEQYLEDVLRFANLASDFYIPDPENSVTRKVDWKVVKQLYPDQQFSASSSLSSAEINDSDNNNNDNVDVDVEGDSESDNNNNSKNKFNNYPLSYLTRLHFRGGMELNQFKKEMHKVLEEAYMREIKDYNTNSSSSDQEKLAGSSSSSSDSASASSSTTTSKLGAIANAQPSAAQLGNAFHCVRWLRNLTQVVNSDHPLQGRVTSQDLFPDESVLGLQEGKNDPVKRRELLGELELIPCYRSELRRRWKNQTGASATSEAIFSTRKQQEDAAAAVRKAASFKPSDATQTTETVQQQQPEKKKEEEKELPEQQSSSSSEKETSKSSPKMDKAKVLQKLKERQAAKRLREEKENEEAASKPEERWSPLFSFYEKKGASTTSSTSAPSPSSDINEEEAKRSNLIHIDKGGAKWVDVPQKVTGNSASAFFLCAHPAMPGFFNGNVLLMHQLDPENGALGFTINRPLRNNDNVAVPVWAVFSQDTVNAGNSGDASAASTSASNSILHHLEDNRIFVGGPVSIAPPPVARGPGSLSYGAGLVGGKGRGSFNHPHHSSHPHGGSQREQSFLRVAHFLHRIPNVPYSRLVAPGVWWGGDEQIIAAKLASKEASPRDVMVMVGFAGWGSGQLEGEICSGSWITAVSKSPRDDKTYERLLSEMESTRPFASPSSSGGTSTEAEKKSDKKKKSSENNNNIDNNNNETEKKDDSSSSSSSSAATATKSKLPSKFDTVADYIFSGNVPVSREERLFDYQKEPDPMPYQWREFIRRLGAPAMARLAVLEPEGNWMNSSSSSSKEGDNRK